MRGESVSSDESSGEESEKEEAPQPVFQFLEDEPEDFGLGQGIRADKSKSKRRPTATELGFEDEDDFEIDDDLVASGSDLEPLSSDDEDEDSDEGEGDSDEEAPEDYEDDEFTKDLLNEEEMKSSVFSKRPTVAGTSSENVDASDLPYSFPCPTTVDELRELADKYPLEQLPKIIQRIRALYHPKLDSKHKEKMEGFSEALVDFIGEDHAASGRLQAETRAEFFTALEQVIRHLHSLAKSQPIIIAKAFRARLQEIGVERTLAMHTGDLLLLHAIGVVFSVSDHFHPVVTPAMLTAARQLGNKPQKTLQDHARGIYLSTLAVSWSQLSKRYVPEAMNSILQTLAALSPSPPAASWPGYFPVHESTVRISKGSKAQLRKLRFSDCAAQDLSATEETELAVALVGTACSLLEAAATTWAKAASFHETFEPAIQILKHLTSKPVRSQLPAALVERAQRTQKQLSHAIHIARLSRRTVELHHHRPLAIKSGIPRFEDTFDPTKHYDPDRERAELAKLRAEHKRERKSAMREIRKDARFMAREQLKTKVARDEAHKKKMDRLVAEIQNEEGREANAYEREREGRKKARSR
jgi:nucleolar protein 14